MKQNPLREIRERGQCVWLDNLHRRMLEDGSLQKLIEDDGLHGVTSNPQIFKQAIADSEDYDERIDALARDGASTSGIYRELAVRDVRDAADLFRPLHDETDGAHGFVSLEVDPRLAHDTEGTIAEARELWAAVDRPNVMIKVPATDEGLPAIRELIAEGINVNVTLLFGLPRYREVAEAHVAGLQKRLEQGRPVDRVSSVASFFLSRIDTLVDGKLDGIAEEGGERAAAARDLRGEVAIASARRAYAMYREIYAPDGFGELSVRGARPQRLLWASTSTKDPAYEDVKYVEPLIGPETVNTMPDKTLDAYRDHGRPDRRLEDESGRSAQVLTNLAALGIDIDEVTAQLVDEGVDKFVRPFEELMRSLERRRLGARVGRIDAQHLDLGDQQAAVERTAAGLDEADAAARIWDRDAAFWVEGKDARKAVRDALGWLDAVKDMRGRTDEFAAFARGVREDGLTHVVHAGMGGSSMTPLVLTRLFDRGEDAPEVTVLDTTDPATVARLRERLPLDRTLFVLASKSGTTVETRSHGDLFLAAVRDAVGDEAPSRFAVITDPGSPLAELAEREGFRATFLNAPDIGGRYSALSCFGLVPAALHGIDTGTLLDRAGRMVAACGPDVPTALNPAVRLGAALGALAAAGRDKVTLVVPPRLEHLGLWLEQLLAESTGKDGRGLVPVAGEPLGPPAAYGDDRVFVRFNLGRERDEADDRALAALVDAGHPLVTVALEDAHDVAQEFFRWEFAVAVAGRVLGIDPFDQPNVQESKDATARLLESGEPAATAPTAGTDGLEFFAEESADDAAALLRRFCDAAGPGRYTAVQAFLPPDDAAVAKGLARLQLALRDRLGAASTLGYGPRYLHSTGQLHKGGPDRGSFLQLVADEDADVDLPGRAYGLTRLQRAQADGDLQALRGRGRPVLRVGLGADPAAGLERLQSLLDDVLPAERAMRGGA